MNAFGEPISVTDNGGTITYDYYSSGLPKSITANNSTISMHYDIHGNRDTLNDPDAGQIVSSYNAFGELTSQTDARGNTYTMLYDVLGRMYQRSGPYGELTAWTYEDSVAGNLGALTSVTLNNGTSQSYAYDALGRITSQTETTGSESFTKTYTYDSYGRLEYENWHTGFGIRNVYNSYGYLSEVKTQDNATVWDSTAYNARGQITNYDIGSDYEVIREYDTYGFPSLFKTLQKNNPLALEEFVYDFDTLRGNLLSRESHKFYAFEDFRYDELNRLVADSLSSTDYRNTDYTDNGNITNRSDVGDFTYSQQNAGPHAVTSLSNTTGTLLPTTSQAVDYTAFNKASHITQGSKDYFITYGPDRLRTKTSLQSGIGDDVLLTKYYALGDFEKETDADGTRELHYLAGGDGLAAIYVKYDTGQDSLFYIMQDHLGSLVGAINAESNHGYRQSFDAWGRERNPTTWGYTNLPDDFPFLRGYTGHEHLKWFGLINMNGRMYDAGLCRFLSPDPYVQMPDNSQNFNRYSYCLNNPLVYTDPSGEFFIGTIFTGVIDFFETVFIDGGIDPWNTPENRGEAWSDFDPTAEWSKTNKAWKIDIGGFKTDENKNFAGRSWELISRWTWQIPQTVAGKVGGHGLNIFGAVNEVNYFHGATVLDTDVEGGAFTLGNYIIGPEGFQPDFRDHLFVHEYGHYRQSQRWGPFYLSLIGIPSLQSAAFSSHERHGNRWFEAQASRYAAEYFDEHYGAGAGGYTLGSINYFDKNSFINEGVFSPYRNPRNGRYNWGGHQQRGTFHWSDPFLYLYLFLLN